MSNVKVTFSKLPSETDFRGDEVRIFMTRVRWGDQVIKIGRVYAHPYYDRNRYGDRVTKWDWTAEHTGNSYSTRRRAAWGLVREARESRVIDSDIADLCYNALFPQVINFERRNTVNESGDNVREWNDCVVCSLSHATGLPYHEVHTALQRVVRRRRKPGTGYYPHESGRAAHELGFRIRYLDYDTEIKVKHPYDPDWKFRKPTVSRFAKENPKGRFFVSSNGHAMAVVDGKVFGGKRYKVARGFEIIGRREQS